MPVEYLKIISSSNLLDGTLKMTRHAVQASTKNFGGGRKAEVNHTCGIGDGQEWYAIIC